MSSSVPPQASEVGKLPLVVTFLNPMHMLVERKGQIDGGAKSGLVFNWNTFPEFQYQYNGSWRGLADDKFLALGACQQGILGPTDIDSIGPVKRWNFIVNCTETLNLKNSWSTAVAGYDGNSGDQTMAKAQADLNARLVKLAGNMQMNNSLQLGFVHKPERWTAKLPGQRTETRWQDPVIPWSAIELLIESRFKQYWLANKFEPKVTRRVMDGMPGSNGSIPVCLAPGAVDAQYPPSFQVSIEIPVFDRGSQTYSFELALSSEFKSKLDAWNLQLLDRQKSLAAGIDVPLMPKPDFSGLTGAEINEAEAWWSQADYLQKTSSLPSDGQSAAIKAKLGLAPTATPEEVKASLDNAHPTGTGTSGAPWWNSAWEALRDAGGGAVDVAKSWGPTGIIGAYAGYEVVKSAKKSTVPAWLILGGIGIAALAITK